MSSTNSAQGAEENNAGAGTVARCRAFLATYSKLILLVFCSFWGLLTICIWGTVASHSWQRFAIILSCTVVMVMSLLMALILRTEHQSEFPADAAEAYLFIVFLAVCSFLGLLVFCVSITVTAAAWQTAAGILAGLILMAGMAILGYLVFFNANSAFFNANEPEETEEEAERSEVVETGDAVVDNADGGEAEDPEGHGGVQEDTGRSEIQPAPSHGAVGVRTRRGDLPKTPIRKSVLSRIEESEEPPAAGSEEIDSEKDDGGKSNDGSVRQNLRRDDKGAEDDSSSSSDSS